VEFDEVMGKAKAKVIFVCGREPEYVRNAMIWQTLNQHFDGCLVADSQAGSLSLRLARLLPRLIYHLRRPHDLLVIGFYGHPLALLARYLTRAPILFDAFVSTYDTLCFDRQLFPAASPGGKLVFWLDKQASHYADKVLLDTKTHADYFRQTFNIPPAKVDTLYLGCDEKVFQPARSLSTPERCTIFTYSTYLPLHGTEIIVEAAQLCRVYPIHFRLIGDKGPTYEQNRCLAERYQLPNLEFIPTIPFSQLPAEIAQATICLGGHFGSTPKAGRVIAGKTYQFMAMGQPVILGDNSANRELFQPMQTAYFCQMNDPQALAAAVIHLYETPKLRQQLSENAYSFYHENLTWQVLEKKLVNIIQTML
jgi:glycosyltransferase involved in cell wall biosynthesis